MVELVVGGFMEVLVGGLSVHGVDHYFLRRYLLHGIKPGEHVGVTDIGDVESVHGTAHKHGLYDDVAFETFHGFDEGR